MKKQPNEKKNAKKKSHKKLWIILAIAAVIIIAGVILAVRSIQNMAEQLTAVMDNTVTAQVGQIAVTTEGIGVVETANTESVYADYNVTLRRLYKQNGEQVAAGEVLAEYESIALDDSLSALEAQLEQIDSQLAYMSRSGSSTVTAPVAGRVKRIYAKEEDSVLTVQSQQEALAVISADGRLKVEFEAAADVMEGQKVKIIYGEAVIDGRIQKVTGSRAEAVFEDSADYQLEQEVTVQSEDGTVLGNGVTACGHAVYVTADSGVIKSISIGENEKVSAGSTLFKLKDTAYSQEYLTLLEQREQLADKLKDAEAYKQGYAVTAAKDGIISELKAKEGDTLPAGTLLCRLLNTEAYQVVLDIDELDIQGIEPGQQVEVTVDAIPDAIYQGIVSGISMAGENTGGVGTYKVSVLLEEAEKLLPGMSANGKITMNQKTDALLVPIDTLKTIDGKKSVTVVKADGTYETREVTVGLVNNEYAEILSGVQEGEELQVIVKLEDIYSQMGITMEKNQME